MNVENLQIPLTELRLRKYGSRWQVFDIFRKKFVIVTPEEWVRQQLLHYMVNSLGFPAGLIKVESLVEVNGLKQRTDAVVYNQLLKPILLIECKRPSVMLTQSTFDQAARYNTKLKIPCLLISNGLKHVFAHINFNENTFTYLPDIPSFEMIQTQVLGEI
jgi:hypothetical protein